MTQKFTEVDDKFSLHRKSITLHFSDVPQLMNARTARTGI